MTVLGIDQITYSAPALDEARRFFSDWGLKLLHELPGRLTFECLNGCRVVVADEHLHDLPDAIEEGPTVREVVWGVGDNKDLQRYADALRCQPGYVDETINGVRRVGCIDPNGLALRLQLTQKRHVGVECVTMNTWQERRRVNRPAPVYDRATPIEIGHVVFFVTDVEAVEQFYAERLGFVSSDRYPGRGAFMRCAPDGGHHNLFLLQIATGKRGINHVAFTVRDIHEVFGGGLHFSRCGWETQLGPGRHPVSSAYFWYFKNPCGGLIEYYADDDQLTADWQPRDFEPGPNVFAEWAVDGGLDGNTRRQKAVQAPQSAFLTEKK